MNKRPLNWYTPIMVLSKASNDQMLLISAASTNGEANVQTIFKLIFSQYVKKDFSKNPTLQHLVNEVRTMFRFYELSSSTTESEEEDEQEENFQKQILIFENDYIRNKYLKALKQGHALFIPDYNITIGKADDFAYISAILLGDEPSPMLYVDARARSHGSYEFIFY